MLMRGVIAAGRFDLQDEDRRNAALVTQPVDGDVEHGARGAYLGGSNHNREYGACAADFNPQSSRRRSAAPPEPSLVPPLCGTAAPDDPEDEIEVPPVVRIDHRTDQHVPDEDDQAIIRYGCHGRSRSMQRKPIDTVQAIRVRYERKPNQP